MIFIFGLLIAFGSLAASIIHLGQSAYSYYDFVGVTMVIGGTFATAIITLPWDIRHEIFFRLRELLTRPLPDRRQILLDCLQTNESVLKGAIRSTPKGKRLHHQILRDGIELIQLGLSVDKIEVILKERMFQAVERAKRVGGAVRSLAKYPPAFGLAGTVLGLVHLMRGVSDGMSPQETGVRMAIALIATFYGLLVANLVVNPAGEAIYRNAQEEEKLAEISFQSILLAAEKVNLLEAQEMLNSFVDEMDRVDVIGLDTFSLGEPTSPEKSQPAAEAA